MCVSMRVGLCCYPRVCALELCYAFMHIYSVCTHLCLVERARERSERGECVCFWVMVSEFRVSMACEAVRE